MKRLNARRRRQSGQAMTEFLVSTGLVLGVLLAAIVMLGKFNDVRNKTLMGSRYVAWERTVWMDSMDPAKPYINDPTTTEGWAKASSVTGNINNITDESLRNQVINRIAVGNGIAPGGNDRIAAQLAANQPAMWRDYGGQALVNSVNNFTVSTSPDTDPLAAQLPSATSFGSVQTASGGSYSARLPLPSRTLRSGTLSVTIGQANKALKRLWPTFNGLTFTDTNVLLTNTWSPDGRSGAVNLFTSAVPAANATLVKPSTYQGLKPYAPEADTVQFGRVQPDVVPADRLSP